MPASERRLIDPEVARGDGLTPPQPALDRARLYAAGFSGGARLAISTPTMPLAPERLSTTNCCFMSSVSRDESMRATMSGEPPGGGGTRKRTGRAG